MPGECRENPPIAGELLPVSFPRFPGTFLLPNFPPVLPTVPPVDSFRVGRNPETIRLTLKRLP